MQEFNNWDLREIVTLSYYGCRDDIVVRTLPSHKGDPGSTPDSASYVG